MGTTPLEKPISPRSNTGIMLMLIFFTIICLFAFVWLVCAGSFAFVLDRSNKNASGTAEELAKAVTATAAANATEYTEPGITDQFDSNQKGWKVGKLNNDFWNGKINIEKGLYTWDLMEIKRGFLDYSDFNNSPIVQDFDTYVDTRIINGTSNTCSGILFRKSPKGWEYGGYAISVCKSDQFYVGYFDAHGKWFALSDWKTSPAIKTDGWNRIEVQGVGSHIICKINDFIVYEMDDSRQLQGKVALFIEVHTDNMPNSNLLESIENASFRTSMKDQTSVTFLFDNFVFKSR